ncbi:protein EMBRYO DEFECTIVE 514 [Eucalyptus grandis]|uniref:protein EMBRYO DEFECTIVE 514 n=1 Tax=Eucalyptus grandis TaxID=71139 RepID=UPI00192EF0B1|nr:protein EMBRYO DEFECTIVE 514 [Eucalyptus grandis]
MAEEVPPELAAGENPPAAEDMELVAGEPDPKAEEAAAGGGEEPKAKRPREEEEEEGEEEEEEEEDAEEGGGGGGGGAVKKQKVEEKSVEEERLEKGPGPGRTKVGPKEFGSAVEMFDYFFKFLHFWPANVNVNKYEYLTLLELIKKGHSEPEKKIGAGIKAFQVRFHPTFKSKCFFLIREDDSMDDFSFRKCVDHIIPLPEEMKAKEGVSRALGGDKGHGGRGGRGRGGRGRGRGRRGKH